jgi:hypothetical protein
MANWLTFEKVKEWRAAPWPFFQYDAIPDELISEALTNTAVLNRVDTRLDWEDDQQLRQCLAVPDEHKHAYRVAALVNELRAGGQLQRAIQIDTFLLDRCGCGIDNGHHRIRALQYLGVPCGPFGLSGYLALSKSSCARPAPWCTPNSSICSVRSCLPRHQTTFCFPERTCL